MDKTEYYLSIAEAISKKSPCLKKHYGAIIVKNDAIISSGYNGPARGEPHCITCTKACGHKDIDEYYSCPAIHAEQNAIIAASRNDMLDATMYLVGIDAETNSRLSEAIPCEICFRLLKNSGIKAVISSKGVVCQKDDGGILRRCSV